MHHIEVGFKSSECNWEAHLVDLLGFEHILEDLEVGDELVFMFCVHLDPCHRYISWKVPPWSATTSRADLKRTIDRVNNLTIRAARATLLYLGIVDLEELVEPCKQVRS